MPPGLKPFGTATSPTSPACEDERATITLCIGANKHDKGWTVAAEENMESQIVRRPDFAGGGITGEEREKMAAHCELWIQRAFRTEQADPQLIEEAIKGIYRAANLAEPRVILAPSPFAMAMAGGVAAVWWYLRENDLLDKGKQQAINRAAAILAATDGATYDETWAATWAATRAVPYVAILPTTHHATMDATYIETRRATHEATDTATNIATIVATEYPTEDATHAATFAAPDDAVSDATRDASKDSTRVAPPAAIYYAAEATTRAATNAATEAVAYAATDEDWRVLAASFVGEEWAQAALLIPTLMYKVCQHGNTSVPNECYLTAERDILGLKLAPHAVYAYWEQAAINGGFRWMHHRFCLVSDFPEVLRVNASKQPHAELGPSHRWRDGWSLWYLNGVEVEQWMAESHPDDMDARRVLQVENVSQRRELIRRLGIERIVSRLAPTVLDTERREVGGEYRLLAVEMNHGEPWRFLQMVNQSTGAFHIEAVPRECETVRHALNWRASQNIDEEWFPTILS
jgi:hypothetical protein